MASKISIPLLHDHHSHPLFYSAFRSAIDFSDVVKLEHALELIEDRSRQGEGIVLGHSWKDHRFSLSGDVIDALPPCAIFNISLHALAINSSALAILGEQIGRQISKLTDVDWYERNLQTVLNWFALLNGSPETLVEFYDYLASIGVWSAEEMLLVGGVEIDWFLEAGLSDRTKFWVDPRTFAELEERHKQQVHGIKLFTDGAFGARTAAITENYIGEPGNGGMLLYSDDALARVIVDSSMSGLGLAVHAIGDRAIEQTVTVLEACEQAKRFSSIRIEHAQAISIEQARRAKAMGIVLSMQPNFNIDSVNYADRLPEKLVAGNNPFRMLIDEVGYVPGEDLLLGSDGMPHGAQFAADQSFQPSLESQVLTMDEFVAGYGGRSGQFFDIDIKNLSQNQ